MKKIAVIAVGGNALASEGDGTSILDQAAAAARTAQYVIDVAAAGWQVVLTHGNGPQVGYILRRSEIAAAEVPVVPMDYATADTQGAIGVMFQRSFLNELHRRGMSNPVATVVTQVEVDPADGAFSNPTKPIGSIMTREIAEDLAARNGWSLMEEAGHGWRRCVASPQPKRVVETRGPSTACWIAAISSSPVAAAASRWWQTRAAIFSAAKPSSTRTSLHRCSPVN